MKLVGPIVLAMCVCANAHALFAQETISYGSISGRVADPQGAVVPGAAAVARHAETGIVREAVTDEEGRFRFPYLRVGRYEITVRMSGFAPVSRAVVVTVGSAFELPVTLAVAGVDANVTVTADTTMLEAARSQIAGTVSQSEIQTLPLNGRNFLDLALLVPGVSPTNTGSTQLFAETSAVPGQGISIGSQRNLSNSFIVDGLSANDDAAGLSGIPYAVDAVDQFQVVTSGGQAELGRALGGYVSVVTKSGTNTLHGDAVRLFSRQRAECTQRVVRDEAADEPAPVRREPRRADHPQPHVLLRQRGAASARADGPHDDHIRKRQCDQRAPAGALVTRVRWWPQGCIRTRLIPRMSSPSSTTSSAAVINCHCDIPCMTSNRVTREAPAG